MGTNRIATFAMVCLLSVLAAAQTAPRLGPGRTYTTIERLKSQHLRAIHADRMRLAAERRPVSLKTGLLKTGLNEYRAVLHAHAEDATHTGGTRPELLAAARRAGVQ